MSLAVVGRNERNSQHLADDACLSYIRSRPPLTSHHSAVISLSSLPSDLVATSTDCPAAPLIAWNNETFGSFALLYIGLTLSYTTPAPTPLLALSPATLFVAFDTTTRHSSSLSLGSLGLFAARLCSLFLLQDLTDRRHSGAANGPESLHFQARAFILNIRLFQDRSHAKRERRLTEGDVRAGLHPTERVIKGDRTAARFEGFGAGRCRAAEVLMVPEAAKRPREKVVEPVAAQRPTNCRLDLLDNRDDSLSRTTE